MLLLGPRPFHPTRRTSLVYGAADYQFTDQLRFGLPMNVVVGVAACLAILWLIQRRLGSPNLASVTSG
jgi:hypothetical protein